MNRMEQDLFNKVKGRYLELYAEHGYLQRREFDMTAGEGDTFWYLYKYLGMNWKKFLKEIRIDKPKKKYNHKSVPVAKILCIRIDEKTAKSGCVPNKPICQTCPDIQRNNFKGVPDLPDDENHLVSSAGFVESYLEDV